jgi:hypothetical protein
MGLVETRLAIIPGGGMSCSLPSLNTLDFFFPTRYRVQGKNMLMEKATFG